MKSRQVCTTSRSGLSASAHPFAIQPLVRAKFLQLALNPRSRASRVNEIVGRLRERGHRLTPQRYAVVRALVEGGEHPSAEQLFHRVSDAYPMMSRATVYKTLDT